MIVITDGDGKVIDRFVLDFSWACEMTIDEIAERMQRPATEIQEGLPAVTKGDTDE